MSSRRNFHSAHTFIDIIHTGILSIDLCSPCLLYTSLHMLYHCLFLHLILEIPSEAQRWDQACDLAVYRLIHHEKKEYRPAILYSQNPELPETCAMDDHQFWKQADRKKLLEQMKNLWNNSYGTGGFGLYGLSLIHIYTEPTG